MYDSDGDVTSDGNDTYGWDGYEKVKWMATSGTPTCGSSGRCATYDAFSRMVEASVNSSWKEYWYTQAGTLVMAGASASYGHFPMNGLGEAVVVGSGPGTFGFLHKDWLGGLAHTPSRLRLPLDKSEGVVKDKPILSAF